MDVFLWMVTTVHATISAAVHWQHFRDTCRITEHRPTAQRSTAQYSLDRLLHSRQPISLALQVNIADILIATGRHLGSTFSQP